MKNLVPDGFFLGGRSLTFPIIAGSLLLTNLSTEQMVGLNGAAFNDGLSVMAWEVVAVIALIVMALYFLPKFLKGGITTVPQFLELRYDRGTQTTANCIFLVCVHFSTFTNYSLQWRRWSISHDGFADSYWY